MMHTSMAAAVLVVLRCVALAAGQSPPVGPALSLPTIFHSSMVLQHSQTTAFWGVAWPGQKVSVRENR